MEKSEKTSMRAGTIKIKNIFNFYNRNSHFESFLTVFVMICQHIYLSKPSVGAGSWKLQA